MKRRRRTLGGAVLAGLIAACFCTPPAAADARSYKNGLNALADSRFTDAEKYFRDAIADHSDERPGGFRKAYLPHYYLGVALSEQGRCAEALEAWKVSEGQGQVQRTDEGAELPRRKQHCLDKVRTLDSARSAAEQAVARARKASQNLGRIRESPELASTWSSGEPSLAAREEAARDGLEEAARLLGSAAGEDPAPLQQAKALASQAATEFEDIRSAAQARLTEHRDAESSALERLEDSEAKARAGLGQLSYLEPFPPELRRRAVALTEALKQVVERKAQAGAAELAKLRQSLDEAADRLAEAAQGPPATLKTAAEAFLAGRYDDVLAALQGETYSDPRASGQACLLKAAAHFELLQTAEGQDPERAATLHEIVLRCRKLVTADKIPARYFSPRFVRYYENPTEPPAVVDEAAAGPPAAGASPAEPGPQP